MTIDIDLINKDKNLYAVEQLPIITVYDDNFFVRNDYDVLSVGQRNYLVRFFSKQGFVQTSGKTLQKGEVTIHLPAPNNNLAVSSYQQTFLERDNKNFYCVTPTMFAEVLFYSAKSEEKLKVIRTLRRLIKKCPYNIEWLRDVSYRSEIESVTSSTFKELTEYQKFIVNKRFKFKKTL